jgi:hypothetical protein
MWYMLVELDCLLLLAVVIVQIIMLIMYSLKQLLQITNFLCCVAVFSCRWSPATWRNISPASSLETLVFRCSRKLGNCLFDWWRAALYTQPLTCVPCSSLELSLDFYIQDSLRRNQRSLVKRDITNWTRVLRSALRDPHTCPSSVLHASRQRTIPCGPVHVCFFFSGN